MIQSFSPIQSWVIEPTFKTKPFSSIQEITEASSAGFGGWADLQARVPEARAQEGHARQEGLVHDEDPRQGRNHSHVREASFREMIGSASR